MKKYNFVCVQTIFNDRMDTKKLRQKILDLAIHGKLVPQDPNDEPASVLLERIRAEKERLIAEGKIKRSKKSATSDTPHYENVPFEVPEGWCWRTLGDIGTWQAGGTPSRMHKEYYGGNIPWLKTGDLNDGIITSIPENITEEGLNNSSAKLNPTGSVLIAMYGATIGKIGILGMPATTNQACCACINYEGVIQKYLFYFLLSHKEEFIALGGGGAQPNISKDIIVKTLIPIPPIKEQERIVSQIDNLLNLLDTLDTNKYSLEISIRQAKSKILDLAIHGKLVPQDPNDEPASELLKRINPKFTPCDNAHYENVPSNWALARVEDIGLLLSGRDLTKDECNSENIGLPYLIGASNIEGNTFSFIRWTEKPQVVSQIGDILISCKGTIGAIVKNNIGDMHIARQFMAIRPNTDGITSDYLHICMIAVVKEIKKDARGVIPGIARDDILTKVFSIPPINEQRRIIAAINQYHSILDNISANL